MLFCTHKHMDVIFLPPGSLSSPPSCTNETRGEREDRGGEEDGNESIWVWGEEEGEDSWTKCYLHGVGNISVFQLFQSFLKWLAIKFLIL